MSEITRWKIGGPADFFVCPSTPSETANAIKFLHESKIPWLVLGHSSNVLVSDKGIRGVVLQISDRMSALDIEGNRATAEAGIWVPRFAKNIGKAGLSGIEHIIGIPGTLGGLVCMNGGSQRRGVGENLVQATCVNREGEVFSLTQDQCEFSYRRSAIQDNGWIVLNAEFEFKLGDRRSICREMSDILASRRKKFPLKQPNCGSVFISDPAMYKDYGPPGAVIERCGLKGHRIGGAEISPLHGNFFVNTGAASASDMLKLIHLARTRVLELTGFKLNCEVRYTHPDCRIEPAHLVAMN